MQTLIPQALYLYLLSMILSYVDFTADFTLGFLAYFLRFDRLYWTRRCTWMVKFLGIKFQVFGVALILKLLHSLGGRFNHVTALSTLNESEEYLFHSFIFFTFTSFY
jgi:hypothetical protein